MKEKLLELLNNSYSPYSKFRVAAIALMKDGTEFNEVNVENASYGGTICAERSAIVSAISAGYKKHDFEKMYVMCNNDKIGMSCMICRQVIQEFFEKDKLVVAMNPSGEEIIQKIGCTNKRINDYKIIRPDVWKQFKVNKKKTIRFTVFSNQNDLTLEETERIFLAFKKMYPNLKTIIPNFVHNWPGIEKGAMKAYWL